MAERKYRKQAKFAERMAQFLPQALDAATEATAAAALLGTGNVSVGLPVSVTAANSLKRSFDTAGELVSEAKSFGKQGKDPSKRWEAKDDDAVIASDRTGPSSLQTFDKSNAQPKISPDVLARMTKGIRAMS